MKLLLDENISYRIVKKIEHKIKSIHISRAEIKMPAKDFQIWDFAKYNDYMIVTFDEDFESLSNLYGFPPKIILLRLGNSSSQALADILLNKLAEIEEFYKSEFYGILEIF